MRNATVRRAAAIATVRRAAATATVRRAAAIATVRRAATIATVRRAAAIATASRAAATTTASRAAATTTASRAAATTTASAVYRRWLCYPSCKLRPLGYRRDCNRRIFSHRARRFSLGAGYRYRKGSHRICYFLKGRSDVAL